MQFGGEAAFWKGKGDAISRLVLSDFTPRPLNLDMFMSIKLSTRLSRVLRNAGMGKMIDAIKGAITYAKVIR